MNDLKKITLGVTAGIVVIFLLLYISNIIIIGDKLGQISILLEILFDGVMILLPSGLLLWYFCKVFRWTTCSLGEIRKMNPFDPATDVLYERFIRHVLSNGELNETQRNILTNTLMVGEYQQGMELYLNECKVSADEEGHKHALMAAVSTIVSPLGGGDMMFMLLWNLRLINQIINIYGFRPTLPQLLRIYQHVLFGGLLAGSIEEILESSDVNSLLNVLPIPGKGALLQASCAIFSTLKTCYLTQYYLSHDFSEAERISAKKAARNFACKQIPEVLKEAWKQIQSKTPDIFSKLLKNNAVPE